MGFWKTIGNAFLAAAEVVVEGLSRWAEKAAAVLGALRKTGEDSSADFKETVYNQQDPDTVINFAQEATAYMEKVSPEVDRLEGSCIEALEAFYKPVIDFLKKSGNKDLVILLESELSKNVASLRGTMKTEISGSFSADNPRFKKIIEKPVGPDRDKELDVYKERVLSKALDNLCTKLEEKVKAQNLFIKNYFNEVSRAKEKVYDETIKEYTALIESIKSGKNAEAKKQILGLSADIAQCDYILGRITI